jgi:hypothetical protein
MCIKFGANLGKSAAGTHAMNRQAFMEESISRTWRLIDMLDPDQTEKGEPDEKQSLEHVHNFL